MSRKIPPSRTYPVIWRTTPPPVRAAPKPSARKSRGRCSNSPASGISASSSTGTQRTYSRGSVRAGYDSALRAFARRAFASSGPLGVAVPLLRAGTVGLPQIRLPHTHLGKLVNAALGEYVEALASPIHVLVAHDLQTLVVALPRKRSDDPVERAPRYARIPFENIPAHEGPPGSFQNGEHESHLYPVRRLLNPHISLPGTARIILKARKNHNDRRAGLQIAVPAVPYSAEP